MVQTKRSAASGDENEFSVAFPCAYALGFFDGIAVRSKDSNSHLELHFMHHELKYAYITCGIKLQVKFISTFWVALRKSFHLCRLKSLKHLKPQLD